MNRDEVTFAEALKRAGYRTGYAGKWHLDGNPIPGWVHPERTMGFDDAFYMFNRGHWKKIEEGPFSYVSPAVFPCEVAIGDEETYTTDWLTNKALAYIDGLDDQPFCYMLSIPDPHDPVDVRAPYDTLFSPDEMELPSTFCPESLPDWAEKLQERSLCGLDKPDREALLRRFLALYCGEVKLIDDCIGRIIDKLESRGLLDNTIVVFTTDHGEYAGEHGLMEKNHLYETAYRIPLVMRWPAGIRAGTCIDNILSTVDFQPTILELMGVPASGREQGRDGSALIRQEECDWEDYSHIHHSSRARAGIFTPEYELALVKDGDSILFDRVNDPDQTKNLYYDPQYADIVSTLSQRVFEHHSEQGTAAVSWLSEMLNEPLGVAGDA